MPSGSLLGSFILSGRFRSFIILVGMRRGHYLTRKISRFNSKFENHN